MASNSINADAYVENLRDSIMKRDDSLIKLLETVPAWTLQQIANLIRCAPETEQTQNIN